MEMTPIQPRTTARGRIGGLVLIGAVGRETLTQRLLTLAPLHRALGGQVLLLDDGTLGGADRVEAARACSDPQISRSSSTPGFPASAEWAVLLAALERRRDVYCVTVGGSGAAEIVMPNLAYAIASNRSFALLADDQPGDLAPHLATLAKGGWPYLAATTALVGFAAGGDGRELAGAIFARLEQTIGERARESDMASMVAGFILARERDPVLAPS